MFNGTLCASEERFIPLPIGLFTGVSQLETRSFLLREDEGGETCDLANPFALTEASTVVYQ